MERIEMAHGAGGRLSHALMDEVILPILTNPVLRQLHDGVVLKTGQRTAFTTDSYVAQPLFFPGGSIGRLAVFGTVNDLAMTGAMAEYISLALILEEGLSLHDLRRVLHDVREAADEAGVLVVTGDTKVVEKGAGSGVYINTAGIGRVIDGANISPQNIRPGMDIIVSGFIGDHAATLLAARHGLTVPASLASDAAPLSSLVYEMLNASKDIAALRDPTRGGVAATLNELADSSMTTMMIDEDALPIRPEVLGVSELLGIDPLELANEGKLIAVVAHGSAEKILAAMRSHPLGRDARVIGCVTDDAPGKAVMRTGIGAIRIVDMPTGALVPRIC